MPLNTTQSMMSHHPYLFCPLDPRAGVSNLGSEPPIGLYNGFWYTLEVKFEKPS